MGQFILKNITMTLDPKSIENAIMIINDLQGQLADALSELARYLTEERGKKIAQMFIAQFPAVDSGALHDSITGEYVKSSHAGKISANVSYAAYIEYGTGIVGEENPHPQGWKYDVNKHGNGGWWYPSGNGWYQPKNGPLLAWTKGMPSRPYMYNTMLELEDIAESEGGQIIAQYIY